MTTVVSQLSWTLDFRFGVCVRIRSCPNLAQFEQFEAERFDLSEHSEYRRPICKRAG